MSNEYINTNTYTLDESIGVCLFEVYCLVKHKVRSDHKVKIKLCLVKRKEKTKENYFPIKNFFISSNFSDNL